MITEKQLEDLGLLPTGRVGYYNLNDDLIIDVEGHIRFDREWKTTWIAQVVNMEELKFFIALTQR